MLSIVVAPDQNILNVTFLAYTPSQINLLSRERAGGTVKESGFTTCNDNGVASFRQSGKYHKIEVKVPANSNWSDGMGVEVSAVLDGVQ